MSDARPFGSKEEAVYDAETGAVLYRGNHPCGWRDTAHDLEL